MGEILGNVKFIMKQYIFNVREDIWTRDYGGMIPRYVRSTDNDKEIAHLADKALYLKRFEDSIEDLQYLESDEFITLLFEMRKFVLEYQKRKVR